MAQLGHNATMIQGTIEGTRRDARCSAQSWELDTSWKVFSVSSGTGEQHVGVLKACVQGTGV